MDPTDQRKERKAMILEYCSLCQRLHCLIASFLSDTHRFFKDGRFWVNQQDTLPMLRERVAMLKRHKSSVKFSSLVPLLTEDGFLKYDQ